MSLEADSIADEASEKRFVEGLSHKPPFVTDKALAIYAVAVERVIFELESGSSYAYCAERLRAAQQRANALVHIG